MAAQTLTVLYQSASLARPLGLEERDFEELKGNNFLGQGLIYCIARWRL